MSECSSASTNTRILLPFHNPFEHRHFFATFKYIGPSSAMVIKRVKQKQISFGCKPNT